MNETTFFSEHRQYAHSNNAITWESSSNASDLAYLSLAFSSPHALSDRSLHLSLSPQQAEQSGTSQSLLATVGAQEATHQTLKVPSDAGPKQGGAT